MTSLRSVSVLLGLLFLAAPSPRQEPLVDSSRELAQRSVRTEDDVEQRAVEAQAWLEAVGETELGEREILRAVAGYLTRDPVGKPAARAELMVWLREHEGLPVEGFEKLAGDAALMDTVRLADEQEWSACGLQLTLLLKLFEDHASVFWLLGRRARDSGTEAGREFLQGTLIPALLADHGLDDAQRVHVLRLFYEVEYTGPRPFTYVSGPDLDGTLVRTADHQGRVLLVDYWATWCVPCLMAMPDVVAAYEQYHDQGFDVVGVCLDEADRRERVRTTVEGQRMVFPQIYTAQGFDSEIARANGIMAIPSTFLIDRRGRVRYTDLEGEELVRRIEDLLAER